ncbi:uncharacterized protein BX663DRAFT_80962 [Cokeromyces recurvatus]|uniref:uncharacterized protein n=1 Tax=Cokeromyces recurvatus TaxID=90255 RepID=UPI00221E88C1|nr:uncharacterized protein BX663DRAFT_80962 [Cokeromyces recurvatus]KAI7902076.1 hypothetical protein BX663DRAFT_80962 [Cokeromyces recurvatus]
MYNSLSKDQRECRCSTCSTTELGYLVVHRHTARAHKQIDEQSIVVEEEEIFYDANNEQVDLTADSINSHNNIDDFDYMADEQILEDNDNTTQHEQFLNISSNEVLPYFVMIFLVFFKLESICFFL